MIEVRERRHQGRKAEERSKISGLNQVNAIISHERFMLEHKGRGKISGVNRNVKVNWVFFFETCENQRFNGGVRKKIESNFGGGDFEWMECKGLNGGGDLLVIWDSEFFNVDGTYKI